MAADDQALLLIILIRLMQYMERYIKLTHVNDSMGVCYMIVHHSH